MPVRKLHAILDELHARLESAEQLDAKERERLRTAMGEIRSALGTQPPSAEQTAPDAAESPDEEASPSERLKDLVEHFEEEHPTLSRRIAEFVDSMHKLGF